jgi:hypothetical protein
LFAKIPLHPRIARWRKNPEKVAEILQHQKQNSKSVIVKKEKLTSLRKDAQKLKIRIKALEKKKGK